MSSFINFEFINSLINIYYMDVFIFLFFFICIFNYSTLNILTLIFITYTSKIWFLIFFFLISGFKPALLLNHTLLIYCIFFNLISFYFDNIVIRSLNPYLCFNSYNSLSLFTHDFFTLFSNSFFKKIAHLDNLMALITSTTTTLTHSTPEISFFYLIFHNLKQSQVLIINNLTSKLLIYITTISPIVLFNYCTLVYFLFYFFFKKKKVIIF